MMWRIDPELTAARQRREWVEFHRECGRKWLYFDNIERVSKRGQFEATAFTVDYPPGAARPLATGRGKSVIDALMAAYDQAGIAVPDAEPHAALLRGEGAPVATFDDLLG